jgi:3-hydroxyisobutyrate dehydrogenase
MPFSIAFVGLGVMGRHMARRLLQAEFPLRVFTRRRETAQSVLELGAAWCDSPGHAAEEADAVITMVGYPEDVEQVYFAPEGILARARAGSVLADMTTSKPSLARKIHAAAMERRLFALDAPVTGGDVGAREGRLSIMAGGEAEALDKLRPAFSVLGNRLVHQGGPGLGQTAKLANQIAVFANTLGACEALAFARSAGLDPEKLLESIRAGAAGSWALENLAPRILKGDFAPGFFAKHLLKDIRMALEECAAHGLRLPGLELAEILYRRVMEKGWGDSGTQVLYRLAAGE